MAEIILLSVFLIGILILALIYLKFRFLFEIKGRTIHMQKPIISAGKKTERRGVIESEMNKKLISGEAWLRRTAYKNTTIKTGEPFFDDSDMNSDYYLVIIYSQKNKVPLLTARYYFDQSVITKYLKGDRNAASTDQEVILNGLNAGKVFLADRLSGNINCSTYRHHRDYIYSLLYSEILSHNKDCKFILMARKEKHEKLLAKYLRLGLHITGSTLHNGKEHWILAGDLKKSYSQMKASTLSNIFLMTRFQFHKLKVK